MATRTLKLTSPAMRGTDVERFQKDLNAELGRWKVPHRLDVDGIYGTATRDTAKSVCYGLGMKSPVLEHGATPAVRSKVRHRKLTTMEIVRFHAREEWRGRYRRRYESPAHAINAAVAFARSMVGISEDPPGSNTGPKIDAWQKACGVHAAPWCGCFVNACLVAGGFPDQEWLRYCPWIEGRARAGEGGWLWTPTAQRGDLALYGTGIAGHVGLVTDLGASWRDRETVEGNTSNGPGGSQSNGGIVAIRHREQDGSLQGFPVRGYARPPWKAVT
jgi:hypothetical protein